MNNEVSGFLHLIVLILQDPHIITKIRFGTTNTEVWIPDIGIIRVNVTLECLVLP